MLPGLLHVLQCFMFFLFRFGKPADPRSSAAREHELPSPPAVAAEEEPAERAEERDQHHRGPDDLHALRMSTAGPDGAEREHGEEEESEKDPGEAVDGHPGQA